ncbi:uncharacterized protein LOC128236012 isoform X2 [Mya arenaria]|uniref:uncharacterized protein LOC128236012 isoform X2 n=1 Tax=Mya arenaria TaxID=6604 RepID=UPI0022E2AF67|nr:uncharacterized protein LOC128236012 isoform X2 [Mya arenaria]
MERTLLFSCILWIAISYANSQDNGPQIDFQRILEAGGSQAIDKIQVDSSSTDTFQVMCRVNNVNQLFKITTLKVQYKTSANAQDFTDLALLQNVDGINVDTYRTPVLASGAGSGWTVEGSFDTTSSNGRDSTLGVSRPVSSITCSNAVEYRCNLSYTMPGPDYNSATGMKSKELDVQVLPTTITRNVYNMSSLSGSLQVSLFDTIEPFYVGQTVKMECLANIGSYNGTAQIRWLKSNIVPGSPLAPYFSPDAVLGDPQSTVNCVYQQMDSVTYNMTAQDAGRTAENRLHFQCYVYIPSMNWESPEDDRGNFKFIVYSDADSQPNTGPATAGSGSAGVIAGAVIGALVAIVIIVLLVYFLWYRRRSAGDDYTTKEEQGASNPNLAPNALYSVPDKKGHENRGLDEPHESSRHHHRYDNANDGYERNGRKNHAMDRDDDDDYHSRDGSPSFGHSNHMGIDPVHGSIGTGV